MIGAALIDAVTLMTFGVLLFSLFLFYIFGKFTLRLIRQHRDIYSLLFEMEEQEKKEKR